MIAQPTIQFDLNGDVRTVAEMASGVVPYVYEQELYGAMPQTMPRLTMGGLLMRLHRLQALRSLLSPDQQEKLSKAQATFDQARKEWPVAYEGKLEREIDTRLKTIGGLLNECKDDQRRCIEAYPSEIEKRVMLEHLISESQQHNILTDVQKAGIQGFDASIRAYVENSPFIWDKRLEAAYPSDTFWYLYRRPLPPKPRG